MPLLQTLRIEDVALDDESLEELVSLLSDRKRDVEAGVELNGSQMIALRTLIVHFEIVERDRKSVV